MKSSTIAPAPTKAEVVPTDMLKGDRTTEQRGCTILKGDKEQIKVSSWEVSWAHLDPTVESVHHLTCAIVKIRLSSNCCRSNPRHVAYWLSRAPSRRSV
eukprot:5448479-Prymnesium_polylepis.1